MTVKRYEPHAEIAYGHSDAHIREVYAGSVLEQLLRLPEEWRQTALAEDYALNIRVVDVDIPGSDIPFEYEINVGNAPLSRVVDAILAQIERDSK